MVIDSTLQFASRRNVPVRYNRDRVASTLKAMDRVAEIRNRRERVFYKKRMAGVRSRVRVEDRKLVMGNEHLLPRVRASEKRESLVAAEEVLKEVPMELPARVQVKKQKIKQRLLVGGGVENQMDLD